MISSKKHKHRDTKRDKEGDTRRKRQKGSNKEKKHIENDIYKGTFTECPRQTGKERLTDG